MNRKKPEFDLSRKSQRKGMWETDHIIKYNRDFGRVGDIIIIL